MSQGEGQTYKIVLLVMVAVNVGIVILAKWDKLVVYVQSIIDNLNYGGNRIALWEGR